MDFIAYLIILCIIGLVVGGLARLALPGRDPMGLGMTILIGIGSSLFAGFIAREVFNREAGFLLAFIVAVLVVYAIRRSRGGGLTDPGGPPVDRY